MPGKKKPSWFQQAFDLRKKRPNAEILDEAVEEYLAPLWTDDAEASAANQEMAFDDWRRHKYPSNGEKRAGGYLSNHAVGRAYDLNVTDEDPVTVDKLKKWAEKNLNQQQFPGMPSHVGPRPMAYRPWEEIEAEPKKGQISQAEVKKYETVCIWCGITCASIEELEAHEDDCA